MPVKKDSSLPDAPSSPPVQNTPVYEGFTDVLSTLSNFRSQITMLQNQIRALEKTVKKNMKTLQREAKKNRNKGNRKPSGFAVPTPISNELCDFMKRPRGSKVARTEVTQYIIRYIKDNDLQYQANRKIIKPNKALRSLLASKAKDEVTYFNIQRYMNRHFEKNVSTSST
jgi:chromatin remodeling complex protein RSC6